MNKIVIFGAKSIALGVCKAIRLLYPQYEILGFMVSSIQGNSDMLLGLPVREVAYYADKHPNKDEVKVVIATPEDLYDAIRESIAKYGFTNYICMSSSDKAKLMETYYKKICRFPSLHNLNGDPKERAVIQVYMAQSYKDRVLQNAYHMPDWVYPIQVGADLTDMRITNLLDNTGDNISGKNANYCELTALYWMWKNKLTGTDKVPYSETGQDSPLYYGLFHYRRILDISDEDLSRAASNHVDVILPFPTIHEPDIGEHHARYIQESDWEAMLQALKELQPAYADAFSEIFRQEYLYNYNIIIAKREVLADYCAWLFPILERTEQLSAPKGWERADRYIGYIGENLLTLYFMHHMKDFYIVHTGENMLT